MNVVRGAHVLNLDTARGGQRLSELEIADRLRTDFARDLDPEHQYLREDEVRAFADRPAADLANEVFRDHECRAFADLWYAYRQGAARARRLVPVYAGGEDPLRATIEALLAKPLPPIDPARSRPRTDAELTLAGHLALARVVKQVELIYADAPAHARREVYPVARRIFDQARRHPLRRRDLAKLVTAAALGGIDPHSFYLDQAESRRFMGRLSGQVGVGMMLQPAVDGLFIAEIFAHGPVARQGQLRPWDKIVAFDGKDLAGVDFEEVAAAMLGPAGSEVRLLVRREGLPEPFAVTLRREPLVNVDRAVTAHAVDVAGTTLGYVKVTEFGWNIADRVRAELDGSLKDAAGLILDLRGNPGGLVPEAVRLIGLFESRGPGAAMITMDTSNVEPTRHPLGRGREVRPLVILVDRHSASASEAVSGSLQTSGRAVVLGNSATYGKGSMQWLGPVLVHALHGPRSLWTYLRGGLPGGNLAVTSGFYFLPDGRSVQNVGVVPDVTLYPARDLGPADTELGFERALPTPRTLTAPAVPAPEVERLGQQRAALAPVITDLAAQFAMSKDRLANEHPDDPEKAAAAFILKKWLARVR